MRDAVKAPLVLTLICGSVCGLLTVGNALTKDKIAAAEDAVFQSSLKDAFGDGNYRAMDLKLNGINQVIRDEQNRTIFDITSTGYEKDSQHLLIGLDSSGAVCGICAVSMTDSPTQAAKVQENAFLSQFYGQDAPSEMYDAVSGATKSSGGVHAAVSLALQTYQEHKEEITHE